MDNFNYVDNSSNTECSVLEIKPTIMHKILVLKIEYTLYRTQPYMDVIRYVHLHDISINTLSKIINILSEYIQKAQNGDNGVYGYIKSHTVNMDNAIIKIKRNEIYLLNNNDPDDIFNRLYITRNVKTTKWLLIELRNYLSTIIDNSPSQSNNIEYTICPVIKQCMQYKSYMRYMTNLVIKTCRYLDYKIVFCYSIIRIYRVGNNKHPLFILSNNATHITEVIVYCKHLLHVLKYKEVNITISFGSDVAVNTILMDTMYSCGPQLPLNDNLFKLLKYILKRIPKYIQVEDITPNRIELLNMVYQSSDNTENVNDKKI